MFEIKNAQRETKFGYLPGMEDVHGWSAQVHTEDGSVLHVSKLDGETSWTADALFGPGSYPHWCNGFGARYLRTKVVADELIIAALDAVAAESASAL